MNFTNGEVKAIRAIITGFLPMVEDATSEAFFNIEKDTDKYFRYSDCLHAMKEIVEKIDRTIEL